MKQGQLRALAPGNYVIEYHDATHLSPNEWVRLAVVDVQLSPITLGDEQLEQFYTIRKDIGELPEKPDGKAPPKKKGNEGGPDPEVEYERRLRTVADALSLALARLGLIAPDIPTELLEEVVHLNNEPGAVIVPDTNALHNGALHWLLRVLYRPAIWILPLVASITTVQSRDATVKVLFNKSKPSNLRSALRSRGLVNGTLGLLERNKGRCQVVEIDPSLLRYQKTASASGADPDQSDVLEDRLIIEGIHNVLRSMRSRSARRVVTSDVNLARVLATEGIETLFVPAIQIGDHPINCLRYDPLARGFIGAPLSAVLWELAHVFGGIRLKQDDRVLATLNCYWPGKSPIEWKNEKLDCIFALPLPTNPSQLNAHPAPGIATSDSPESGNSLPAPELPDRGRPGKRSKAHAALPVAAKKSATSAILPRASLPQILRLLGALRRLKGGDVDSVVRMLRGNSITLDTARRAFEILLRTGLVQQDGELLRPTKDASVIDQALRRNDLDTISAIFENFEPYKIVSTVLREQGQVARAEIYPLLTERLGRVGTEESDRLPRYHMLLGQAWSANNVIYDGSNRPTDRDATEAFRTAFADTAHVGLAKVVDLLPRFCVLTRMSPWAAKLRLQKFVADRLLADYSFQPAAGGKPIEGNEIVSGSLDDLVVEPVVIDRLHLGEKPVFTVGGPTR